jgi:hypothetical protein
MQGRVKNGPNVARSAIVRERVLDHLMQAGGRHGPERMDAVREDFIEIAMRHADRVGLRTWKGESPDRRKAVARRSLATLLEEIVVTTPGKKGKAARKHTGVNHAWVLDIWEAALDYLHREPIDANHVRVPIASLALETEHHEANLLAVREQIPFSEALERVRGRAAAGELIALNDGGPTVVQVGPSLSARLLDAYLERDDESIMRIAVEVEGLETRTPRPTAGPADS